LSLSVNPNAIDLLKERIEYENNLTKKEFNNLKYLYKIDWELLSYNSNAIDILNPFQLNFLILTHICIFLQETI
tara:strand:- start:1048 stop:1269 length:222 start_codon:yes stop_codon:yes gene_type:complete